MRLNGCLLLALTHCVATIDEGLITGGGGATTSTSSETGGGDGGTSTSSGGSGGAGGVVETPGTSRIFFLDLTHVPRAPGYLAVHGRGFGGTRGASRVTLGGLDVVNHLVWSDDEVRVEVPPDLAIGAASVVVHVEGDGASNAADVIVTDAPSYFVDPLGNDGGEGTLADPFETLAFCAEMLAPGGVCYVRAGTFTESAGPFALSLTGSEDPDAPKAIASYPGEVARIESDAGGGVLLCDDAIGDCTNEGVWTLAGLELQVATTAVALPDAGRGTRLVANQIACAALAPGESCVLFGGSVQGITLLGNRIAGEASATSGSRLVAFAAGSRVLDVGWNEISGPTVAEGLEFEGAGDVHAHDNAIFDIASRGLEIVAEVPPNRIVNNVFYRIGDGTLGNACVALESSSVTEPVELLHNTIHGCDGDGTLVAGVLAELHNNVFSQPGGASFIRAEGFMTPIIGSHNLFDGSASIPVTLDDSVIGDAGFASVLEGNFELTNASDALNIAADVGVLFDRRGVPRGPLPDAGAYELQAPK